MVASQHDDLARVSDLEGEQEDAHLDRIESSVYVIAQEEKLGPNRKENQNLLKNLLKILNNYLL